MNSFDQLISQLNRFSKKYHAVSAVKGALIFSCYAILLLLTIGLLEFFLNFSSFGRVILFYGIVTVLSIFFFSSTMIPVLRFFGVMKRLDHISAAKIIGSMIPEIGDKLIGYLEEEKWIWAVVISNISLQHDISAEFIIVLSTEKSCMKKTVSSIIVQNNSWYDRKVTI